MVTPKSRGSSTLSEQTKLTAVKRYREGHYMRIRGQLPLCQENRMITNIYAPHIETPIKQTVMELKGEINRNTIIAVDFNSPLLTMETSSRLRINNERVVLNNTIEQMDLTDIQDSPPDSNRMQLLLKHAQNIFQYR